jgi:hypothetical protein
MPRLVMRLITAQAIRQGALGPKGNATGGYFGQAFANITRRRLAGPGGVL